MRYTSTINNLKCVEWELTLSQAFLLDILIISDLWAKRETVDGVDYRWVSRNKILDEIPHAYKTADTVYRSLKDLADKGIIDYKKLGKKDLIRFTDKGKEWVFCPSSLNSKLGNKSESDSNSEIDPSKFGNNPENNSDSNPTDNGTNLYNGTNDDGEIKTSDDNAEKVKDRNAEFVVNWQAPSKKAMEDKLFMAGTPMQMTDGQYQLYVEEFKAHFEERAKDGHPLKSDGKCQARLRDWLQRERKDHNEKMNAGGETANRPHSNRSDSFNQSNGPKLTREQQIEKNKQAMQQAGLPV